MSPPSVRPDETGQPLATFVATRVGTAVIRKPLQLSSASAAVAPLSYTTSESPSAGGLVQLVIWEFLARTRGTVESVPPMLAHTTEVPNTERNSIAESLIAEMSEPTLEIPRKSDGSIPAAWRICWRVWIRSVALL